MVFDRGMVSDDNLEHLENSKSYFYITALNKDQIAGVDGANLKRFETFTEETTEDTEKKFSVISVAIIFAL